MKRAIFEVEEPSPGWLWIWTGQFSFGMKLVQTVKLITFDGGPRIEDYPRQKMWGITL